MNFLKKCITDIFFSIFSSPYFLFFDRRKTPYIRLILNLGECLNLITSQKVGKITIIRSYRSDNNAISRRTKFHTRSCDNPHSSRFIFGDSYCQTVSPSSNGCCHSSMRIKKYIRMIYFFVKNARKLSFLSLFKESIQLLIHILTLIQREI